MALASLDDACRCMSSPSQGLRWAFGQTSPLLSRVACIVGQMHLSCRYQAAPHPAHRPILYLTALRVPRSFGLLWTWVLPRRPSGDRRIAPGVVNGLPSEAAGAEETSAEEDQASLSSQLVDPALASPATTRQCSSDDASVLAWATEPDAICRHATLVPQPFLRLAQWTRTCPSLRGSHLITWTRSGRLDRTYTICHFRTLSSRGAVAGYGDCDPLLPSMILLILWKIVFRCRVLTSTTSILSAQTLLPSSFRLLRGCVLHSAWMRTLRPMLLRQKCLILRMCQCHSAIT